METKSINPNQSKSFSLAHPDPAMISLISRTDQKTLAIWAIDCTNRVMHFFVEKYPNDKRPRDAINTLQEWINSGVFSMKVIREASLASHKAAREIGEDNSARSAARAAGQAVATAHVPGHAYGPAIYAQQAIYRASNPTERDQNVIHERDWQYNHLVELTSKK